MRPPTRCPRIGGGAPTPSHEQSFASLDLASRALDSLFLAQLFALGLGFDRHLAFGHVATALHDPGDQPQYRAAQQIHHPKPAQTGGEGDGDQQRSKQEQAGAKQAEQMMQPPADPVPEQPARLRRKCRTELGGLKVSQARTGKQTADRTGQAQRRGQGVILLPGRRPQRGPQQQRDENRERVGGDAGQSEGQIGEPGPGDTAPVGDRSGDRSGVRPARVAGLIAPQARGQVDQHRHQEQDRSFPQHALTRVEVRFVFGSRPGHRPFARSRTCQSTSGISY